MNILKISIYIYSKYIIITQNEIGDKYKLIIKMGNKNSLIIFYSFIKIISFYLLFF